MSKSGSVPPNAAGNTGEDRAPQLTERGVRIRAARGVVLVTGTSSGMGLAATSTLVRHGYHVIATVLAKEEETALLSEVPASSVSITVLDITDPDQVKSTVEFTRDLLREAGVPGLAGLVNNAGVGVSGPMEALPVDRIRWQFEVNVFGQLALTQGLLPMLRAGHGRIVNIGSVGAWITMPFGGPLTASKAAFRACSDALRMELKPSGVPVIMLEPARVKTGVQKQLTVEVEKTTAEMSEDNRKRYESGYRTMVNNVLRHEEHGSTAEPVADAILRALTAKRPRSRQPIGRTAVMLGLFGRVLPNPVLDRMRYRLLGLKEFAAGTGR